MSAKKKPRISEVVKPKILRPELFDDVNIEAIRKAWQEEGFAEATQYVPVHLIESNVEIFHSPFPVCLVRDLVPTKMIKAVISEIPHVKFHEKSNDLYQFHQTTDVANFGHLKAVTELYTLIKTEVFNWVERTFVPSGLKLETAATFSCYAFGDRLLCHDDKCEDRHIAFVLYLTEGWTASDGGNLELLRTDSNGDPQQPVVSIPALYNTLVLFEVSPRSYHQVTEVMSQRKKRLSLNGWFHKANLPESTDIRRVLETVAPSSSEVKLEEYMFVKYLSFKNQLDIKTVFVANSEIQLDQFLQPSVCNQLEEEFESSNIEWCMTGPANMRHYEVADPASLPTTLSYLYSLLQSRTWLRFLRMITGLDMVPLKNSDLTAWQQGIAPSCRVEVQRWLTGSYTLVHDGDPEFHTSALDVFLRFPMAQTELPVEGEEDGPEAGHIIYIDKQPQDGECLLHLGYKMNSLGLIFREPGTYRFTKYLDINATPFYQIQCILIPWAPPDDQPDLKHVDSESETEPSDVDADAGEEDDFVTFEGVEGEELEVEELEEELRTEGSACGDSGDDSEGQAEGS